MGHSATLLQQLAAVESEIERIDESLAVANQPLDLAFSIEAIRDFVASKTLDFKAAFDSEPVKAKEILARHINQLVLTPRDTGQGSVYDVSGDVDLFGGDGRAMSLLADACSGRATKKTGLKTAGSVASGPVFNGSTVRNGGGGQRRDRTADAGLFRAAGQCS